MTYNQNEYNKKYYQNNKEKAKEYARKYRQENREMLLEKDKNLRERNRVFLFNFKKNKRCSKCGWDKFPPVLEFHHITSNKKIKDISYLSKKQYSLKKIKEEISKCILLCPNCHRTFHHRSIFTTHLAGQGLSGLGKIGLRELDAH